MTTKLNPGKPDGQQAQITFVCGHGTFLNPCKICQGAFHSAVFDRVAPSPQPSAEATERKDCDCSQGDRQCSALLPMRGDRFLACRFVAGHPGKHKTSYTNGQEWEDVTPAPSGETRTCAHCGWRVVIENEPECCTRCKKPLAPEATTKEIDPRYTFVAGNAAPNIVFDSEAKEPDVPHCFKCEHNHFGACKAAPGEAVGRPDKSPIPERYETDVADFKRRELRAMAKYASEAVGRETREQPTAENPPPSNCSKCSTKFILVQYCTTCGLEADERLSTLRRERDQLRRDFQSWLARFESGELDSEQVQALESQVRELTAQRDNFEFADRSHSKQLAEHVDFLQERNAEVAELRAAVEKLERAIEKLLAIADTVYDIGPTLTEALRELSDMRKK